MLYRDLVVAIGDQLNREDLYTAIPDLIAVFESKANRRLRVRRMVTTAVINIAGANEPVPSDFLQPITFTINPSQDGAFPFRMDSVDIDALNQQLFEQSGTLEQPTAYALIGNNFAFAPNPDGPYTGYLTYYGQIPGLSASNTSNWMLANYPDVYLYGALAQVGLYAKDGRIPTWQTLSETGLQEIELEDRRAAFGAAMQPRPTLIV